MLSRRSFLLSAAAASAAAALSACGEDGTPSSDAAASSGAGSYPRTVEHELGSTEIPDAPQRVV